ncbi:MAG: TlpA family protein disulfide reductase [Undibacterium sp.]|nr:TlpA family protein disulfide reductase [Opitutaceae bacterium]
MRILFILCTLALTTAAHAQLKVGDPFPPLASSALTGGTVPETSGKILVVDFWASWCAPCKASFPALGKINADYAARGLVLVGVSVDEKASAYAAFVKKLAPPFPTLQDAQQKLVRTVVVPAMPTTYVVGRDGRIRSIHAGYHGDTTDKLLRTELDALLAEK